MKMGGLGGPNVEEGLRPVSGVACALGEGPTWDAEAGMVRWVDIDSGVLYEAPVGARYGAGAGASAGAGAGAGGVGASSVGATGIGAPSIGATSTVLTVDGTLGAAVHAEGGGFLLATSRRLEHRDAAGVTVAVWELIPAGQARRLNDGACDPAGRYVVGSMSLESLSQGSSHPRNARGDEQLWRLEHDGSVTVLDEGLSLSNGIAWSPDGRVMYSVDTLRHRVYARSYDSVTGDVGVASVLIDVGQGSPDGLTVDSVGDLWIAMWGEGEIRRFAPDGSQRDVLRTGAPYSTSCAFVGPELDLLVVTSASGDEVPLLGNGVALDGRLGAIDPGLRRLDGRLLAVHVPVTGLPTRAWRPCAANSPP